MQDWGWAIPSVLTIVVGLWLRHTIQQTPPKRAISTETPFGRYPLPGSGNLNPRPWDWRCADDRGQL